MTTRNVRLSDDDIDRLLDWFQQAFPDGSLINANHWLHDRLVEAKLSPSMDWPAGWPDGGADKHGSQAQTLGWNRGWPGVSSSDEGGFGQSDMPPPY